MSAGQRGVRSTPFIITETSQLESTTGAGAKTVEPGETAVLAEYEIDSEEGYLLAVGATDDSNVTYTLETDNTPQFTTRSPLGLLNEPYSLQRELGFVYPAERFIKYTVTVDSDASESKTLAARMFVTEAEI